MSVLDNEGHDPNGFGNKLSWPETELNRLRARVAKLEKPWQAVDGMDWEYIFSAIGHGGRDRFWRAVLHQMRDALQK